MRPRIVVFGATGYTGRLTAEHLVAQGALPLLAGRSEERLRALSEQLGGLDWQAADIGRERSVHELVGPADVLVSTVGPFMRWGEPAVRAAVSAGATYIDSTGEPPFLRRVFEDWGPGAARAGSALVPACGYDYVPGALAGALALEESGVAAARVDIGYFALDGRAGGLSRGTRASIAGMALADGFAFRAGRVQKVRPAERTREFAVRGAQRAAISLGGAEHFTLPASYPRLREVNVYLGWFGGLASVAALGSRAGSILARVPGVKAGVRAGARAMLRPVPGPDPGTTPGGSSWIVAITYDAAGDPLTEVTLAGVDAYAFTAGFIAYAARRALDHGVNGVGALGPVEAFGLKELERGCAAAGLVRV